MTEGDAKWVRLGGAHWSHGRAGWFTFNTTSITGSMGGASPTREKFQFAVSANNTTISCAGHAANCSESVLSCVINITDVRLPYNPSAQGAGPAVGHYQCGTKYLQPVPAVSAVVTKAMTPAGYGNVDLRWTLSPDDLNTTQGNMTYRVFLGTDAFNFTKLGANLGLDPRTVDDANGKRYFLFNASAGDPTMARFTIRAEDTFTRFWTNVSCVTQVHLGHVIESYTCGAINGTAQDPGAPQYPLMDMTLISSEMGITMAVLGYILGGITILALGVLGFRYAGGLGAGVAAALGLGLVAALNLFDEWVIALVFVGAASIVFLGARSGGGDS